MSRRETGGDHSAATDHHPAVRLELWDDAPPTAPDGWDHVLEPTCDVQSAVRPSPRPTPHTHFRSRGRAPTTPASTGNQGEAAELDERTFESGIERRLIQLWQA
ncbi:MAG: hypothetical protein ABIQ18_12240 [Umezawaea sp.]